MYIYGDFRKVDFFVSRVYLCKWKGAYYYHENKKNHSGKYCCNHPKIESWVYHRVMCPKDADGMAQCANHLYANRNLRYSKCWPSFLLCCFWRVFSVYEELILLWFCLLDSIFKQHYYLRRIVWSEVLCFSILCLNHQTWHKFRRITCLLVMWH